MSFILRSLRRNYGLYASVTAGGFVGFSLAAKNFTDVRQIVSKDVLEISENGGGTPYIHVERKLQLLSLLPLRTTSRIMGYIADVQFPGFIMRAFLSAFAQAYNVALDEAVDPDLSHYKTFGSFFNRPIKESCRHIDKNADLISPCDGRILAHGRVSSVEAREGHFKVEQVKGITFSLTSFLGGPLASFPCSRKNKKDDKTSDLFFCTIYLAPGDYHSFVTPTNWQILGRRHFSGRLFSVKPKLAEIIRPLFTLNERVLYTGQWQHGFFSFTAVGATNVGKIAIDFDKELQTNKRKYLRPFEEKYFASSDEKSASLFKRGDPFGHFRLGSTIVLIFEAPHSTQFTVQPGERILLGQSLTNLTTKK